MCFCGSTRRDETRRRRSRWRWRTGLLLICFLPLSFHTLLQENRRRYIRVKFGKDTSEPPHLNKPPGISMFCQSVDVTFREKPARDNLAQGYELRNSRRSSEMSMSLFVCLCCGNLWRRIGNYLLSSIRDNELLKSSLKSFGFSKQKINKYYETNMVVKRYIYFFPL